MKKIYLSLLTLLMSMNVHETVSCPAAKVEHIQPDADLVFIKLEGQDWQKLGGYEEPSINAKLSVALAAFATEKEVVLRFPAGHDSECSEFNKTTSSIMIRIL